jgi:hypothetical protein
LPGLRALRVSPALVSSFFRSPPSSSNASICSVRALETIAFVCVSLAPLRSTTPVMCSSSRSWPR